MKKRIRFHCMVLTILLMSLSLAGAVCEESGNDGSSLLLLLSGATDYTVTSTLYDTSNNICRVEECRYFSKSVYMSEDFMLAKLNIKQDWNLKSRKLSTDAGADLQWLTDDDTYSIWMVANKNGDTVNRLYYDTGDTSKILQRESYTVNDSRQTKLLSYGGPGSDSLWNTDDDDTSAAGGAWSRYDDYDSSNKLILIRYYSGDGESKGDRKSYYYNSNGSIFEEWIYDSDITRYGGRSFEYRSDRTVVHTKDSSWETTEAVTFVTLNQTQIKIFYSSDDGPDETWGTDDDTKDTIQLVSTIIDGLIFREDMYDAEDILHGYFIYSYR